MKKITLLFCFLFLGITTEAQFTDLLNFNNTSTPQGGGPFGSLTLSVTQDTLFGMTLYGGANEAGCIFSVRKDGSNYHDMADFTGTNGTTPGAQPFRSLVLNAIGDTLFGMTWKGGANSMGCIFSILTDGSNYTDLYDFTGTSGRDPMGSLTLSGNTLYGMTSEGGLGNEGCIFSISTSGNNYQVLLDFNGISGSDPEGSLILLGNMLYGMTELGGTHGKGVIFSVDTNGSRYQDLWDFNASARTKPQGSLIISGNKLYGMNTAGGLYADGFVFSLDTNGSGFRDLLSFNGTNGAQPYGSLLLSGGVLYGMTMGGGGTSSYGTMFSIDTNGSGYEDLHDFNSTNGANPYGDLVLSRGALYGMTNQGGLYDLGVVFKDSLPLSVNIVSFTNIVCNGSRNGIATALASMGTSPYTYAWSPGGSTAQTATGLSAGIYTITVTDNNGATASTTATITQPAALSVTATMLSYASCTASVLGSALATASGGALPYTYAWSNGTTTSTNTGLIGGTYTVILTDSCGASVPAKVVVYDTNTFLTVTPQDTTFCLNGPIPLLTFTASAGGSSTYLWSDGETTSTINLIFTRGSPHDTTFYVTSSAGLGGMYGNCIGIDTVKVTFLPAVQPPIIDSLTSDSVSFFVTDVSSSDYVWTLSGSNGHYAGVGDTAWLPIWPRNDTLIFYADSGSACQTSDTIIIAHNIPLPSINKPYPRWSKRGMYMDWCPDYDLSVSGGGTNITQAVDYCRSNHIYYVALNNLLQGDIADYVFDTTDEFTNPGEAPALAQFIDSLKTRGNVEEIGICSSPLVGSIFEYVSIADYNSGKPWNEKIDILSLDEEFPTNWLGLMPVPPLATAYTYSLLDFHGTHMPNLMNMSRASHGCPHDNLRVEDFIETPLDPWGDSTNNTNYIDDTALFQLEIGKMELDSIDLYTDRIILSSYTLWPNVLWNEGDFIQVDSEFGSNPNMVLPFYNKEIWPAFDPANSSTDACVWCADQYGAEDFLGDSMCLEGVNPVNMEQRYFDSLSTSENSSPRIFTNNFDGAYARYNMGNDTSFQILGCVWFMYGIESGVPLNHGGCVQNWTFDTNAVYTHPDTTIPFYVTVGHDSEYINYGASTPPITVTATVHGGKPPYSYTWYDLENGNTLLYSTTGNTYTTGFNLLLDEYPVSKLGVVIRDRGDSNATDYLCIYEKYTGHETASPVWRHVTTDVTESAMQYVENNVKVYPNPNKGEFTVKLSIASCQYSVIEVYNVMGEKVLTESLRYTQGDNTINMSNQPNGIYFYRVLDENSTLLGSGKIIIEK